METANRARLARIEWLCLLVVLGAIGGMQLAQAAVGADSVVWCDDGTFDAGDFRQAIRSWNKTNGNGQLIVTTHRQGPPRQNVFSLDSDPASGVGVQAGLPGEDDPWADASSSNWIATDMRQGPLAHCDIYLARSSAVPLYFQGYVEDLSAVRADPRFQWERLLYPARSYVGEFGAAIVSVPLEFDFPMLFYRRDLVFYPPTDWEDLLDMAQQLNSTDMNDDGIPDFGFCVDPAAHFGQLAFGIVASIMKTDQTFRTGVLYDVDSISLDLDPLFATEGYAYALSIARRMWKLSRGNNWLGRRGPTSEKDWGDGKCAFYLTWAAGGGTVAERQYVRGRSGFAMMPGSTKVYSRGKRQLENCSASKCPYSRSTVNRPINQPTFEVGSKRLVVRRNVSNMNAVMDVMAAAVAAVRPWAEGVVPSTEADLLNFSNYVAHGWDDADAYSYLGAVSASVFNPHIASVRLIPMIPTITGLFIDALGRAIHVDNNNSAMTTTDMDIAAEFAADVETALLRSGYTTETLMPDWLRSYLGLRNVSNSATSGLHPSAWLGASVGLLLAILAVVVAVALHQWRRRNHERAAFSEDASTTDVSSMGSKGSEGVGDGNGTTWRSTLDVLTILPGAPVERNTASVEIAHGGKGTPLGEKVPKTPSCPSQHSSPANSTSDGSSASGE